MATDRRELLLNLLKEPTQRDQQVHIGASNASNPCARCLGDQLQVTAVSGNSTSWAWAGAVIGTAVHLLLDQRVHELHPEMSPEKRVTVGTLEGYGVVKSTTDLYHAGDVTDWKTTTRKKLPYLKDALETEPTRLDSLALQEARFKAKGYKAQLHLYGLALENEGLPVNTIGIGFVCRDAVGDDDIWGWDAPYSHEYAMLVWDRLVAIWEYVQENGSQDLDSDPMCWYCNNIRA